MSTQRKSFGLGDLIALFAQPVAWVLWVASLGRCDYRRCAACDKEKARLNAKYPGLFSPSKPNPNSRPTHLAK